MEKLKRFLRFFALICMILLASIGMGLTGAAPVYSKNRDALSETKTPQEHVGHSKKIDEDNIQ